MQSATTAEVKRSRELTVFFSVVEAFIDDSSGRRSAVTGSDIAHPRCQGTRTSPGSAGLAGPHPVLEDGKTAWVGSALCGVSKTTLVGRHWPCWVSACLGGQMRPWWDPDTEPAPARPVAVSTPVAPQTLVCPEASPSIVGLHHSAARC